MQDHPPVLEIRDLMKRYGSVLAVDRLTLDVGRGEIFGLLGPNGAGKTTTLRMLGGLIRPSAGSISVFGRDLARHRIDLARRCGFLIESPGLHPHLSARDNLAFFARLKGLSVKEWKREVDDGLAFAELGGAALRPVCTYSTGMKQKTALAAALLGAPDLVILDEPTAGLEPESVVRLRDLIRSVNADRGTTFVVSSHHLAEMETLCHRVGIIAGGRLLATGPPESLRPEGPTSLRLRVSDPGRGKSVAEGLGVAAETGDPDLLVVDIDPPRVGELVKALVEEGVDVLEVRPARSVLERAYLHLTRMTEFVGAGP